METWISDILYVLVVRVENEYGRIKKILVFATMLAYFISARSFAIPVKMMELKLNNVTIHDL